MLGPLVTPASAQTHDPAWFVQAGEGDRAVRSVALGLTRDLSVLDPDNPSPWSFYVEGVIGEWFAHHRDPGERTDFTQITAAPVVRYSFSGFLRDVFIEAGIGLSVITPRFRDHGRMFGSTFNFDDHASLGFRQGEHGENEFSMRAEHFSNAGIKKPNPGQNFLQLRYARHF